MNTCGQMTDDELRLKADTHAEAVLEGARFEVRLAEKGLRRTRIGVCKLIVHASVVAVVEGIDTGSDAEDRDGYPVCRGFDGSCAEKLHLGIVVAVVVLLHATRSADLYCPGFVHAVVQFARHVGFGRGVVFLMRMIAQPEFSAEHVIAGIRVHNRAVGDMMPSAIEGDFPTVLDRKIHV